MNVNGEVSLTGSIVKPLTEEYASGLGRAVAAGAFYETALLDFSDATDIMIATVLNAAGTYKAEIYWHTTTGFLIPGLTSVLIASASQGNANGESKVRGVRGKVRITNSGASDFNIGLVITKRRGS